MGWLIPKPTPPKKSPWKSSFLTLTSPFDFPNLTKTLGWVGGKTDLGKLSQKNGFIFVGLPWRKSFALNQWMQFGLWLYSENEDKEPLAPFFQHPWYILSGIVEMLFLYHKKFARNHTLGFLGRSSCLSINLGLHHFDRGRACLLSHGRESELFWI